MENNTWLLKKISSDYNIRLDKITLQYHLLFFSIFVSLTSLFTRMKTIQEEEEEEEKGKKTEIFTDHSFE